MSQVFDVPIKQYKTTKKRIMNLLIKNPEMRDDLELTISTIWFNDIKAISDPAQFSFMQFLNAYRQSKVTPSETIRRSWQKIQEDHPQLRGKNFAKRHRVANQVSKIIVL